MSVLPIYRHGGYARGGLLAKFGGFALQGTLHPNAGYMTVVTKYFLPESDLACFVDLSLAHLQA